MEAGVGYGVILEYIFHRKGIIYFALNILGKTNEVL